MAFDPFSLSLLLFKLVAGMTAVAVAMITFQGIVNWFKQRQKLKAEDKNIIAFTLKEKLSNGDYAVCQGIFNSQTQQLLDGQKFEGKIDRELEQIHQGKALVVYE